MSKKLQTTPDLDEYLNTLIDVGIVFRKEEDHTMVRPINGDIIKHKGTEEYFIFMSGKLYRCDNATQELRPRKLPVGNWSEFVHITNLTTVMSAAVHGNAEYTNQYYQAFQCPF